MKIGSLFSGIGGLELGLERSIPNAKTVWQVEKDPYARAVLAKHWPETKRFKNVEKVGAHNLESVELICGGFPCQDLSIAGKQAGIDGARSGLWREFARIIGEIQPRFVIVENVPALLGRGMDRVLGDLAARGYDAIWDCIPAAFVNAPHRRDRLFIVGFRNISNAGIRRYRTPEKDIFSRGIGAVARNRWPTEPGVGRVGPRVPYRVDRLKCLGNAVVPQVAAVIGRVVVQLEGLE